jgi:hypothetical protein
MPLWLIRQKGSRKKGMTKEKEKFKKGDKS